MRGDTPTSSFRPASSPSDEFSSTPTPLFIPVDVKWNYGSQGKVSNQQLPGQSKPAAHQFSDREVVSSAGFDSWTRDSLQLVPLSANRNSCRDGQPMRSRRPPRAVTSMRIYDGVPRTHNFLAVHISVVCFHILSICLHFSRHLYPDF